MFIQGFKKQAFDASLPPSMPDPNKARQAAAGAMQGQSLSKGWANMKNEVGSIFGGAAKATR